MHTWPEVFSPQASLAARKQHEQVLSATRNLNHVSNSQLAEDILRIKLIRVWRLKCGAIGTIAAAVNVFAIFKVEDVVVRICQ